MILLPEKMDGLVCALRIHWLCDHAVTMKAGTRVWVCKRCGVPSPQMKHSPTKTSEVPGNG